MKSVIENLDNSIRKLSYQKRAQFFELKSKERYDLTQPKQMLDGRFDIYNFEYEFLAFRSAINSETEYNDYPLEKWLNKCMDIIRNQDYLQEILEKRGFKSLLTSLSFFQFIGQQTYSFLLYRYHFFYNYQNENIDMNAEFVKKFGVPYLDFEAFIHFSHVWVSMKGNYPFSKVYNDILSERMKIIVNLISDTKENIQTEYQIIKSEDETTEFSSLNLLLKTPFIFFNGILYCFYVPYIPYACTISLMYRLTENNDNLRDRIGKNVFEEYVFDLCNKSRVTNIFTIKREFDYTKQKIKSPDINIYSEDSILFIEAKFMNQGLGIRRLNEKSTKETYEKISRGIMQLYKSIKNYEKGQMESQIDSHMTRTSFGLLLTYDDFFLSKTDMYNNATKFICERGINVTSESLEKHIWITSLNSFENILYHSEEDIFNFCKTLFAERSNLITQYIKPFTITKDRNMPAVDEQLSNRNKYHKNHIRDSLNKLEL